VRARLHTPLGTAVSNVKPGPTRNPESVSQLAAIGDGSSTPIEAAQRYPQGQRPEPAEAPAPDNVPHTGDDRRKDDRRRKRQPTTLDTRKGGTDRRRNSRISLKV